MPEIKGRTRYVAVGLLLVLAMLILWQVSFNVGFMPTRSEQTILLFVLSILVSLTFLIFGFILSRNILKLNMERRANLLGSKFKTKLVIGALALSLLPVCLLFYFSYALMNRTLERWFNQPTASLTRQTREITSQFYTYSQQETESNAAAIANGELGDALRAGDLASVRDMVEREARREGVDYLSIETPAGMVASFDVGKSNLRRDLAIELPSAERFVQRSVRKEITSAGAFYSVAILPVFLATSPKPVGWVTAANRLPDGLIQRLAAMNKEEETYNQLYREKKTLRSIFIGYQALATILILFVATWVALFLSKQVTIPIAALAEGTHEVGMGNLGFRIKVKAVDELGVLVQSFNDMISRLEESGAELERRRRETEAMLESIPTPVISLSRDRRVVRINPAVERMLGAQRAAAPTLRELFAPDELRDVDRLLRRSLRQGLASGQLELMTPTGKVNVAVTVSALRGGQRIASDIAYIVVMEDLSDLLSAQQSEAWQEVARRVAHEIKNPLTPIALSAERIRRRVESIPEEERTASLKMINDCSQLIDQEVNTLKTLVDEFSQMARFPKAQLDVVAVNPIIESALAVFDGRLDGIQVHVELASDLPEVKVDAEQLKRLIVNLVDNAAEAMEPCLFKELRISTARLVDVVEVAVADTGPGVNAELKEKLFMPYFSTKKRGTGLGLAIASHIVAEHHGTIRVEENDPVGARFIVELPVG